MSRAAFDLVKFPVHLGLGARAIRLPAFTGDPSWYERYGAEFGGDGVDGRCVTIHSFSAPWSSWEVHPRGDELVVCLAGSLTLIQDIDGEHRRVTIAPYEAAINPAGVWHTADADAEATALFITAGIGTEHRER